MLPFPTPHHFVCQVAMSRGVENAANSWQYYRRPGDGALSELCVQSFEDAVQLPERRRWSRIGKPPFRISSLTIVSHCVWSPTFIEGREERRYNIQSVPLALLKAVVALPLIFLAVSWVADRRSELPLIILY